MQVIPIDKPEVAPFAMPARFAHDIAYFMTPAGEPDTPPLGPGEYWVRLSDAQGWLEDGVVEVISPLDSQRKAEIELTEEQEQWLEWMVANQIQHVKLVSAES
jgi:hypothetical protein